MDAGNSAVGGPCHRQSINKMAWVLLGPQVYKGLPGALDTTCTRMLDLRDILGIVCNWYDQRCQPEPLVSTCMWGFALGGPGHAKFWWKECQSETCSGGQWPGNVSTRFNKLSSVHSKASGNPTARKGPARVGRGSNSNFCPGPVFIFHHKIRARTGLHASERVCTQLFHQTNKSAAW